METPLYVWIIREHMRLTQEALSALVLHVPEPRRDAVRKKVNALLEPQHDLLACLTETETNGVVEANHHAMNRYAWHRTRSRMLPGMRPRKGGGR